jgi:hypothetical protein
MRERARWAALCGSWQSGSVAVTVSAPKFLWLMARSRRYSGTVGKSAVSRAKPLHETWGKPEKAAAWRAKRDRESE